MLKTIGRIRCPGGFLEEINAVFDIEKSLKLRLKLTKIPKTSDFMHFYLILDTIRDLK